MDYCDELESLLSDTTVYIGMQGIIRDTTYSVEHMPDALLIKVF